MYYRGSHAALVVYDLTSEQSFDSLKRWVKELQQYGPPNIVIAIAGNQNIICWEIQSQGFIMGPWSERMGDDLTPS